MSSDNAARTLIDNARQVSDDAARLAERSQDLASDTATFLAHQAGTGGGDFITALTVFLLACFVGYYVVWKVTPALHSPLMAVTNAISSVIIVGALIAAGLEQDNMSKTFGFIAVTLASVNIFGGFIVTRRMLHMFKKSD